MPKLPAKRAKEVANASSDFELIPDDTYRVQLKDVKVSDKEGPSGYHYWTWELAVVDGDHKGRKLWTTTSLSPESDFAMKAAFEAFGYTTDTDTDEILGDQCLAIVGHRTIEKGQRKGQETNTVDQLLPLTEGAGDYDPDEVI